MNKKIIFITLTVVILAGLFVIMKPRVVSRETHTAEAALSTTPSIKVNLVIKDNKIVNGPETIKANEGDMITITALADVSDEIHIHGLDKHLELELNKPGTVTFKADQAGRFQFELESAKRDLGVIEIQPKQ